MKRGLIYAALLICAGTVHAQDDRTDAQTSDVNKNPQDWYVAPMLSLTKVDKQRLTEDGLGGALAIGHRGEAAAVELAVSYSSLPANGAQSGDAQLLGTELSLVVGPFFQDDLLARLFGVVGFGVLQSKGIPAFTEDRSSITGSAGIGYMHPLRLFGKQMHLRTEVRYRYDVQKPPHVDGQPHSFDDLILNVGLQTPMFHAEKPEAKTEAVAVVAVAAPTDSDLDGVPDDRDQCAGTMPATTVNEIGCEPITSVPPDSPITLDTAKVGDTVVLSGVHFDVNQATLTPDSMTLLDGVAAQLQVRDELKVEIGGHTDASGDDSYNQDLSHRRAEAVRTYLVEQGAASERLTAVGYGETAPVDSNDTREGRALNRRVELKILE